MSNSSATVDPLHFGGAQESRPRGNWNSELRFMTGEQLQVAANIFISARKADKF